MRAADALNKIRRLVAGGPYLIRWHAYERMAQRGAVEGDVVHALVNATSARYQADRDNWKVFGLDQDGDDMTIVVAIEADIIIITLW